MVKSYKDNLKEHAVDTPADKGFKAVIKERIKERPTEKKEAMAKKMSKK
jgi:hypothetical protein